MTLFGGQVRMPLRHSIITTMIRVMHIINVIASPASHLKNPPTFNTLLYVFVGNFPTIGDVFLA
jgi:hypothetical protein